MCAGEIWCTEASPACSVASACQVQPQRGAAVLQLPQIPAAAGPCGQGDIGPRYRVDLTLKIHRERDSQSTGRCHLQVWATAAGRGGSGGGDAQPPGQAGKGQGAGPAGVLKHAEGVGSVSALVSCPIHGVHNKAEGKQAVVHAILMTSLLLA